MRTPVYVMGCKKADCINFVPVANADDRQKLVQIPIGKALQLYYYTAFRDPSQALKVR